jgi:hypothetical protein
MTRRLSLLALFAVLAASTAWAAVALRPGIFLGAQAGVPQPFESVALPPVALPAAPAQTLLARHALLPGSAFAPPLEQLLSGDTVITSDAQMLEVWQRLFAEPYDAGAFDFESTFVVLMGGGVIANGTFGIESVETVEASYADAGGPGGSPTGTFLSVTAVTFLTGVPPVDPPSPVPSVSAVAIDRALLGDVVFHRTVILGV